MTFNVTFEKMAWYQAIRDLEDRVGIGNAWPTKINFKFLYSELEMVVLK